MLTLLGSLLGFGTSIFPSILEFFQDSKEKKHELASMEMQMILMNKKSELNIQEAQVSGELNNIALELKAEIASVKASHEPQKLTGITWVDALRGSVRPIVTYWFMSLYTFSKVAMFIGALEDGITWTEAGQMMFTEYDLALFATILSFWFGDRIRKYLRENKNA